jgi:hypothetical protein
MEACTKQRRLVVTSSGQHLGLAPARTRPGDAVIVIVGHGKPVVARRSRLRNDTEEEGAGGWHIVGEAYVHGLMAAEGLPVSTKR